MTFEERPKGNEGANDMNIWGTFEAKTKASAKTLRWKCASVLKEQGCQHIWSRVSLKRAQRDDIREIARADYIGSCSYYKGFGFSPEWDRKPLERFK